MAIAAIIMVVWVAYATILIAALLVRWVVKSAIRKPVLGTRTECDEDKNKCLPLVSPSRALYQNIAGHDATNPANTVAKLPAEFDSQETWTPTTKNRSWIAFGFAFCLLGLIVMATDGGDDRVGGTLFYLAGTGYFFWRLRHSQPKNLQR